MHYFQAVLPISHRKQMVLLKKKPEFEKIFFSPFVVLLIEICLELMRWSKKQCYLQACTSCGTFHLLEYMRGYTQMHIYINK